ncbi:MAG: dienelactone hydrolase family protein [Bacteroidales bacterium]|nr:dienelactone hydrolase family protein [Bacteroidales bacterium]
MKLTALSSFCALMLLFCPVSKGQDDSLLFRGDTLLVQGDTLPYLLYNFDTSDDKVELPLVIFLHGAGERGDDNQLQLRHCVRYFMQDTIRDKFNFRMLIPQCGSAYRWAETDWTLPSHTMEATPSHPMSALMYLIDSLIATHRVDTCRIYAVGISMGGFGVWDLMQRRPNLLAAAVPICGGGDPSFAMQLTSVPIRIFHGKRDRLVMPSRSVQMYEAIRSCGGEQVSLELFDDLGHACWNRPFEQCGIIGWLFSQRKYPLK